MGIPAVMARPPGSDPVVAHRRQWVDRKMRERPSIGWRRGQIRASEEDEGRVTARLDEIAASEEYREDVAALHEERPPPEDLRPFLPSYASVDQAWDLVKYLTTNTHALAKFSNGIRNVPSTVASSKSKELAPDRNFATFLGIFTNPHSATTPITAAGNSYGTLITTFTSKWQAGHVGNLGSGLQKLDKNIDAQLAQAKKGSGVP